MNMELVPTEDLVKELISRCDHGALILMRCREVGHSDNIYVRRWKGDPHTCIGLLKDVGDTILATFRKVEQPWNGEGT